MFVEQIVNSVFAKSSVRLLIYAVLSPAELAISQELFNRNKSQVSTYKRCVPRLETWGTPCVRSEK